MACSGCTFAIETNLPPAWQADPWEHWTEDASQCARRFFWRYRSDLVLNGPPTRVEQQRMLERAARAWFRTFVAREAARHDRGPTYQAPRNVFDMADDSYDVVMAHAMELGRPLTREAFFEDGANLKAHLRERARLDWWPAYRDRGVERTIAHGMRVTFTLPELHEGRALLPDTRVVPMTLDRIAHVQFEDPALNVGYWVDVLLVTSRSSAGEVALGTTRNDRGKAAVFGARFLADTMALLDGDRAVHRSEILGARYTILRTAPPFTSLAAPDTPWTVRYQPYSDAELDDWYDRTRRFRAELSARDMAAAIYPKELGPVVWPTAEYVDGPCTRPWPCEYGLACDAFARGTLDTVVGDAAHAYSWKE